MMVGCVVVVVDLVVVEFLVSCVVMCQHNHATKTKSPGEL
jgi:hypothetical protein